MSFKEYLNIVNKLPQYRNITIKSKLYDENEFTKEMGRNNYIIITALENTSKLLLVLVKDVTGADNIRGLIHSFTKSADQEHNVIIISDEKRKESIMKFSDTDKYDYSNVKYYHHNHVKICLPESSKVPPHKILSKEEAQKVKSIQMLKNSEFPIISSKEAMSLWLGFKSGDLIQIDRISENSGTNIIYRYCV